MASKPSAALSLDLERRLRAVAPLAPRKVDRVYTINLTGDMTKYVWSLTDVSWTKDVPPLPIAKGERVELTLVNKNPMPHPMHLHGHQFQIVEIDGQRFAGAVRDTVLVRDPVRALSWHSTPATPDGGRSIAICCTISQQACSPPSAMSDQG